MDDYRQLVTESILDEQAFIKATFSNPQKGQDILWKKVVARPVLLKNKRHLQVSHFDQRKDVTKNYPFNELSSKVTELVNLPFRNIHVQMQGQDLQIQISKKGKAIVHRHKKHQKSAPWSLSHDRQKSLLLPNNQPDPFLQTIGIMTKDGKVRADRQGKFKQINEFLKLILETAVFDPTKPLNIVDCGCGNAYLTFAVYYYLHKLQNVPLEMVGIDVTKSLLDRRAEQVEELGWHGLTFQQSTIIDFEPQSPPNMVLALHACDTATDETLARALKWNSEMIFVAPCCHHHLQAQLAKQKSPSPFTAVMKQGPLKERLGDILTDNFRTLILKMMGYQTDIVEFVSTEHTGKNLLIRAKKSNHPADPKLLEEYNALKAMWQVTPYLETLLKENLNMTVPF
ncbi:MAG: SAM-dependent methyltransferase [Chloroflexota bacterium]